MSQMFKIIICIIASFIIGGIDAAQLSSNVSNNLAKQDKISAAERKRKALCKYLAHDFTVDTKEPLNDQLERLRVESGFTGHYKVLKEVFAEYCQQRSIVLSECAKVQPCMLVELPAKGLDYTIVQRLNKEFDPEMQRLDMNTTLRCMGKIPRDAI